MNTNGKSGQALKNYVTGNHTNAQRPNGSPSLQITDQNECTCSANIELSWRENMFSSDNF